MPHHHDHAGHAHRSNNTRRMAITLVLTAVYLQPEAILSSPFLRCVQTVQPLADELDLPISKDDRFTPGRTEASVRQAFLSIPANSVVSTHGEVIAHLFDERVKCAKGAFWVVERRDSQLLPTHYVEAPARRQRPIR